jgi:hypothetical protein
VLPIEGEAQMHLTRSGELSITVFVAAACATAAHAQSAASAHSSAPTAYVYVSSVPANSNQSVINAYAASPAGELTAVNGSPFSANDSFLSVNRDRLYGVNQSPYIDSYSIEPDGSITYLTSTNYAAYNPGGCGVATWIFPDRTGTDLYALNFDGDCSNNTYQSFKVQKKSGELKFLGNAEGGAGSFFGVYLPLSFLGNNVFGYEATNNGCFYYTVWGFQRTENGDLNTLDISAPMPPPPSGYNIYIPMFAAADHSDHVAIAMQAANPPGCSGVNIQIGSFTADSQGNLSTTNTSENMPVTAISYVEDMKIAPRGKLLAIAGTGGLQVFRFEGAAPPEPYTPILTSDDISQIFWDSNHHLYALSQFAGRLHVYAITTTSYEEAPGSPYTINQPLYLAVHSR